MKKGSLVLVCASMQQLKKLALFQYSKDGKRENTSSTFIPNNLR